MVMKLSSFEKKALNNMVQNFSLEDLMRVIDELSIVAWDQKMQRPSLESWLSNFTGKVFGDDNKEKILALLILMNYTYYSEKEVRELCKCSYNAFIHEMLHESCQTDDISSSISEIINTTYFSPLGNVLQIHYIPILPLCQQFKANFQTQKSVRQYCPRSIQFPLKFLLQHLLRPFRLAARKP